MKDDAEFLNVTDNYNDHDNEYEEWINDNNNTNIKIMQMWKQNNNKLKQQKQQQKYILSDMINKFNCSHVQKLTV